MYVARDYIKVVALLQVEHVPDRLSYYFYPHFPALAPVQGHSYKKTGCVIIVLDTNTTMVCYMIVTPNPNTHRGMEVRCIITRKKNGNLPEQRIDGPKGFDVKFGGGHLDADVAEMNPLH